MSPAQLEFAQDRIRRAGLDGLATLEFRDYRDLTGNYDAGVNRDVRGQAGEQYLAGLLRYGCRATGARR